ncbi:MAG: ELM1/GtrOC1 family putative glycosyltransferase [Pseudomonadota bacterium]
MAAPQAQSDELPDPQIAVVSDGKAGHLNQSLGLAEALQRLCPELQIREFPALSRGHALQTLLWPGPPRWRPRLLIGAGHGTHLSLLALRRRERCPALVLMKPSLPRACFDLCIEPRHDGGEESSRRWLSDGPLNRIRPAANRSDTGLLLIGGPSPHFVWDQAALLEQVRGLCNNGRRWQLSTSRRTPPEFLPALRALALPGLEARDSSELPGGWLAEKLPRATLCCVTPDSASMIYEALTAGCTVGVFDLEARQGSRVAKAVADLRRRGLAISHTGLASGVSPQVVEPLAEADRIAGALLERGWL